MSLLFEHTENVEKEGILEIRYDQPQRPAGAARQRAGVHIGVVFEFAGRLEDPGARAAPDNTDVIQDSRYGSGRYSRSLSYVFEIHRAVLLLQVIRSANKRSDPDWRRGLPDNTRKTGRPPLR